MDSFGEWLNGLIEDDPIPYETAYLTFIITEYKDRFELMLTGSESPLKKCEPDFYFPLECQCFFEPHYFLLRPLGRQYMFNYTKQLILDFFAVYKNDTKKPYKQPNGRSDYKNKTISLGFRGKKPTFLVKT